MGEGVGGVRVRVRVKESGSGWERGWERGWREDGERVVGKSQKNGAVCQKIS